MTLILNSLKKENAHQNVMRLKVKECSFSSFSVVCKSSWPINFFQVTFIERFRISVRYPYRLLYIFFKDPVSIHKF